MLNVVKVWAISAIVFCSLTHGGTIDDASVQSRCVKLSDIDSGTITLMQRYALGYRAFQCDSCMAARRILLPILETAVQDTAVYVKSLYINGVCLARRRQIDSATVNLKKLDMLAPGSTLATSLRKHIVVGSKTADAFTRGLTLYHEGRYAAAASFFRVCLKRDPSDPDVAYFTALSLFHIDSVYKSVPFFEATLDFSNDSTQRDHAREMLCKAYTRLDNRHRAAEYCGKAPAPYVKAATQPESSKNRQRPEAWHLSLTSAFFLSTQGVAHDSTDIGNPRNDKLRFGGSLLTPSIFSAQSLRLSIFGLHIKPIDSAGLPITFADGSLVFSTKARAPLSLKVSPGVSTLMLKRAFYNVGGYLNIGMTWKPVAQVNVLATAKLSRISHDKRYESQDGWAVKTTLAPSFSLLSRRWQVRPSAGFTYLAAADRHDTSSLRFRSYSYNQFDCSFKSTFSVHKVVRIGGQYQLYRRWYHQSHQWAPTADSLVFIGQTDNVHRARATLTFRPIRAVDIEMIGTFWSKESSAAKYELFEYLNGRQFEGGVQLVCRPLQFFTK